MKEGWNLLPCNLEVCRRAECSSRGYNWPLLSPQAYQNILIAEVTDLTLKLVFVIASVSAPLPQRTLTMAPDVSKEDRCEWSMERMVLACGERRGSGQRPPSLSAAKTASQRAELT